MFQDIKPKKRLREVLPNSRKKTRSPAGRRPGVLREETATAKDEIKPLYQDLSQERVIGSSARPKRYWPWVLSTVAAAALFGLIVLIASLAATAEVEVTPKQTVETINEVINATRSPANGALVFNTISTEWISATRQLPATGVTQVNSYAEGWVIIYNNFSRSTQQLVDNTRLQTPDGKVFRIQQAVTVPGLQIKNGQTVPGSVEVAIKADKPGADYNVGLADFTIPGFKDTPRFSKIYARSKTPVAGGFSGERKTVDGNLEEQTRVELRSALRQELLGRARAALPADALLYEGAAAFEFESGPLGQGTAGSEMVIIEERSRLTGAVLSWGDLSTYILQKYPVPVTSAEVKNLDQLKFTFLNTAPDALTKGEKITFRLVGEARTEAIIDAAALKNRLVGLKSRQLESVLSSVEALQGAKVTFRPAWWRRVPSDPERIKITIKSQS